MPSCTSHLQELRVKAGLSKNRLAALAEVDRGTVSKAERGGNVQDVKLSKMLKVLSRELGREIRLDEITA